MAGEDLEILDPAPTEVTFRGERLEIKPLTVGQLPKFLRLARPLLSSLLDSETDLEGDGAIVDLLVGAIADHGECAIDAAALVTGKPIDWFSEGNPAEFLRLAIAVFKVNRDFFLQELVPLLAAGPLAGKRFAGNGPTPSSNSSGAGTP
jgi:hypothetical protein